MRTIKPRTGAWMLLLVLCAPLAALAIANLVLNPSEWPYSVAVILIVAGVVGYNLTVRLVIDDGHVTLKRYGRVVWTAPRRGTEIADGLAGDVPFIPALVLLRDGRKVGYLLKMWFDERAVAEVRKAFVY